MKIKIFFEDGTELEMENIIEIDEIDSILEFYPCDSTERVKRPLSKFELEYMKSLQTAYVFYESDLRDESEESED